MLKMLLITVLIISCWKLINLPLPLEASQRTSLSVRVTVWRVYLLMNDVKEVSNDTIIASIQILDFSQMGFYQSSRKQPKDLNPRFHMVGDYLGLDQLQDSSFPFPSSCPSSA